MGGAVAVCGSGFVKMKHSSAVYSEWWRSVARRGSGASGFASSSKAV